EILYSLANHLRKKRLEEGGLDLTLPEVVLAYKPDGRLELFWVDLGSPSRRIVQEAMILYNQLAAAYLVQGGIPALYRVQEGPMERLCETEMDRILYVFLQRRRLLPLTIGTEPGPHVPLGVSSYVQITSPIRRFLDLIVQRQISASLMGATPPYDQKALENIKARIEPILKEQERVRRASMTHWLLRYFHQNQGKTFHGLVLDDLKTRFRIIIKEALFVVEAKKDLFKGNINQGDELLIRIKKVDPWTRQLEIAGV
ncbi:MAG: RNB domain-containing ribonuclease, partial [Desulfatiglandales bacterium]